MAWVVPLSGAMSWTWATRGSEKRLVLPWKSGVLLTFAVAMSWFVVVCFRYPELWNYFLGYELVERFASTTHGRSKPWWFFIPILVIGAIPWTGFLPGLARQAVEKIREKKMGPVGWFLGSSVVIPFVVVSCSGSKLLTYILPIYPALALALAIWLSGKVCPRCEKVGWGFALISLGVLGPMLWCVRYVWSEAAEVTPSTGYLVGGDAHGERFDFALGMENQKGGCIGESGMGGGSGDFSMARGQLGDGTDQ